MSTTAGRCIYTCLLSLSKEIFISRPFWCVYVSKSVIWVLRALFNQCFPVLKLTNSALNMCSPSCSLFITGSIFSILAAATEIVHPDIVQYFADIQRQNPFDPRLVPHYHANGTMIRENIIDVTLAACREKCGTE